jgi:hypothetical protein
MDISQILPHSQVIADPDNSVNQKLVRFDPRDCEYILKHRNSSNRPIRRNTVTKYAEDMKAGRFRAATHQTLAFDTNGNLLDGQHRLSAIAQTKQPHILRVWFNRDSQDFSVIDAGVARLASDNLHYLGVPKPKIVAPGVKHILLYKKYPNRTWTNLDMPSSIAINDFYYANQSVIDMIADMVHKASIRCRTLNRTGLFVLCFLALESGHSEMDVNGFCSNLSSGAGLSEDNPILAYRNFLQNNAFKNTSERNLQQFSTACMIKVWNYTQQGQALRQFKAPSYPPMPTIELLKAGNDTKVSKNLRYAILSRDKFTCKSCGAKAIDGAILEVDHIIPRSKGGSNDPSNLRTLCSNCNGGKSNKLEQDLIF